MSDTIEFIDQTMRDGQQSLWGMRMQAKHMLPVAHMVDRVGFHAVDITGSSLFEVLIRYCRENPWETLDHVRAAMPTANLRAGSRAQAMVGFGLTPNSIMELWIRTLAKHGINSFWIFDCLFNLDQMEWLSGVVHDAGAKVSPAVMYTLSPVHTDEFFAERIRGMTKFRAIDQIYVEDAPGVLTPERTDTLVPAMLQAAGDIPLEMHFHNTTGLASLNYLRAIEHGARIIHTASEPLANGPSLPSTEVMLDNVERAGYRTDLDRDLLPRIADHFRRVAEIEGYELGRPNEYSTFNYEHQLPGGMTGTLKNQLRQYQMEDRLRAVLEETSVVRAELGYPVMATPFSQLMGIQAMLNIVTGERYSVVPDEVIQYVLGHLGPVPGDIDQEALDRILSTPRGKEYVDWEPPQPTLEELRREHGGHISDEELLLRVVVPGEDVDAMYASGPIETDFSAVQDSPKLMLIRDLVSRTSGKYLRVDQPGLSLTLRRP